MAFLPQAGCQSKVSVLTPYPALSEGVTPELGVEFYDKVFGSIGRRVGDYAWGVGPQGRHEYGRLSGLSSDNRYLWIYIGGGWYQIRDLVTGNQVGSNFAAARGDTEFCTFPSTYPYGYYRSSNLIYRVNMTDGTRDLMMTIKRSDNTTDYFTCLSHQEGKPDYGFKYWALDCYYDTTPTARDFVVIDCENWTVHARLENTALHGNWISMTPSGKYVVLGSDTTAVHDRVYNRDTLEYMHELHVDPTHSDFCLGVDGEDYLIYYAVTGPQQSEAGAVNSQISAQNVRTGVIKNLVSYYNSESSTWVSGFGSYTKPGWCLISTYRSLGYAHRYQNECYLVNIHTGEINRIACTVSVSSSLWAEPQALFSWDAKNLIVASNWNMGDTRYESYHYRERPGTSWYPNTTGSDDKRQGVTGSRGMAASRR